MRVAKLIEEGVKPENIFCVTFTKKAKENMIERIQGLIGNSVYKLNIGTFHSLCLKMLNESNYISGLSLIKTYQQEKIINDILDKHSYRCDFATKDFISFIAYQKNYLITPNDDLRIPDNMEFLEGELREVYFLYEKEKDKIKCIDFGDMILKCYQMLVNDEKIRTHYQNKYEYITVDESQDTSISVIEILKILSTKHNNVFMVGDCRQSIFGFVGGEINNMLKFGNNFPNATQIELPINYRSTSNIVELGNKFISHSKVAKFTDSIPFRGKGVAPVYFGASDEDEEAEIIAKEILELHNKQNTKYKDIAILTRTNSYTRALEDALINNEIPYVILSSLNFFNRSDVLDIISYMRVIQNNSNDIAIQRIINVPNRYLGKVYINSISTYANNTNKTIYDCMYDSPINYEKNYWKKGADSLTKIIRKLSNKDYSPKELINKILEETDYIKHLKKVNKDEDKDVMENIMALMAIAQKSKTVDGFLNYIDNIQAKAEENNKATDKVTILTTHKSKGMEFDTTFIVGMSVGLYPHFRSTDTEEELRLAYVSISRAINKLYISWTELHNNKVAGKSYFVDYMTNEKGINKVVKGKIKVKVNETKII